MSFNASIPVITDPILQSSYQLKANFQAINAAFSTNHVGLTQNSEFSGMHNFVTLRPQNSDPATSATQIALYNKLVSSVPQMFYRPNNSQTPIQMTYSSLKADETNTQYSFVAGPFIVYGGLISNPTYNQLVSLSPGTTLLYVDLIIVNMQFPAGAFIIQAIPTNISGNSFNITFQNIAHPNFDVYYFAIGV